MKNGLWKKFLSLILVLALAFQLLPLDVLAAEEESGTENTADSRLGSENGTGEEADMDPSLNLEDAAIAGEIEELRQESVKHFRLEDGSYIAVDYGYAVHYQDEESGTGVWREIDNTLKYGAAGASGAVGITDPATPVYVTSSGAATQAFSANYRPNEVLFSSEYGDSAITFALAGGTGGAAQASAEPGASAGLDAAGAAAEPGGGVAAVVTNPNGSVPPNSPVNSGFSAYAVSGSEDVPAEARDAIEPQKVGASVTYSGVCENVDLQYQVRGYNVKESIVVTEPRADYSFTFALQLTNLTPEMQEDGSVVLYNGDGEAVYEIPAPFMVDGRLELSDSVFYTLEEMGTDCYTLTVTADAEWINDPDREFPVSIDPTLIVTSKNNSNHITTGFTRSGLPNASSSGSNLYFGYSNGSYSGSTVKEMKALMSFGDLPGIPANCSVTGALVNFRVMGDGYSSGGLSKINAQLHEVTGEKPSNIATYSGWVKGITWNTMPAYSSTIEDYCTISSASQGKYISWDISRVVAKWYETGTEKRVLAMDAAETLSSSSCAAVAMYSYGSAYYPYLVVQYRNNVGIEDYFTYQTVSAGKAGTGYIGDYTSQLVLANTIGTSNSNTLPFGVSLYYNSAQRNTEFADSSTAGIHTVDYSAMKTGAGWKLSIQESIRKISIATATTSLNYYVYNDADGTEHYFLIDGQTSPYSDEDGLGLSLTVSGTTFTLKDQKDNSKVFYNGYLSVIKDANGNAVYLVYNGGTYSASSDGWKPKAGTANYVSQIVRLNDGAGSLSTLFTLAYSSGRLSSVTDGAGRKTTLTYATIGGSRRLSTITYPDATTAKYTYSTANGAMLKAYDSEARVGIGFEYQTFGDALCIQKVREFAATSVSGTETVGNQWNLRVFSPYHKEYRFYGPDQTPDTGDDTVVRYTFDHTGKTVNIVNLNYDGSQTLGVSAAAYTPDTNNKTKNRVSGAAAMGGAAVNLLNNSGFEDPSDSSAYKWDLRISGSSDTTLLNGTIVTSVATENASVTPYHGEYLLKTYVASSLVSSSGSSSAARRQKVYLKAGTAYVFSGWANSMAIETFGTNGGLVVQIRNSAGTVLTSSNLLGRKTSASVNGGWVRLEGCYTPSTSGWYYIYAAQRNASGYGAFDDIQLEATASGLTSGSGTAAQLAKESGASSANLVQLGSFELWNGASAVWSRSTAYWTRTSSASGFSGTEARSGYSLFINGAIGEKRRANQTIQINKTSNSTYVLSGWAKAVSAPNCALASEMSGDNSGSKRFFGVIVQINYTDTATAEYQYLAFDDNYTDWQYGACVIVPKRANKTVSTITVKLAYDHNVNCAYFDNISLVEEPAQTYTYDSEGKLTSVSSTNSSSAAYTYTGADLTKEVAGGYGTYEYTYDGAHNMTKATNDGVSLTAAYDAAGNCTSTILRRSDGTGTYLKTSATYTSDKNLTASVTDANGSKVSYTYDSLDKVHSAAWTATVNGTSTVVTKYTSRSFESGREMTSYISNVVSLRYAYTRGLLSDVVRHSATGADTWQRYHLAQDAWGNTTSIKVQRSTPAEGEEASTWTSGIRLASYQYAGQNGYLNKMTYADGAYETYTYDRYGRVAIAEHYASGGALNYTQVYVYDGNGNTGRCKVLNSAGTVTAEYRYEYDSLGRLIRSELIDGGTTALSTEHQYDTDNRLTKQSYQIGSSSFTERYTYNNDDGSLASMTTAVGTKLSFTYDGIKRLSSVKAGSRYTKTYAYRTISDSRSSLQVSSLKYSGFTGAPAFGYTYTKDGNIASETLDGVTQAAYKYDEQGQLLQVDGNIQYNYTYDAAGNLLAVQRENANGIDLGTNTYTYGNAHWADLLTAFNGQRIAYEGQTYNSAANTVSGSAVSGNPVSYYNGTRWAFTWENGRQLATAFTETDTTDTTVTYAYDMNGLRTEKTVVTNTYEPVPRTVTFVAEGVVVKTMTVDDSYVLTEDDYPEVPAKEGYSGAWTKYTSPITENVTVDAVYTPMDPVTVTFALNYQDVHTPSVPMADSTAVAGVQVIKIMTVAYGYVLKDSDYPTIPEITGYVARWSRHIRPVTKDITITAKYTAAAIVPIQPPGGTEIMSAGEEGTLSASGTGADAAEPAASTASVSASSSPAMQLVSTVTEKHTYTYASGKLLREVITTTKTDGTKTTVTLDFCYDQNGAPFAMKRNGVTYYYITNLQGDVVQMINTSGLVAASYTYDPYGKITSATGAQAEINPLRYRGYCYDGDTGFYYLQSRYYDPAICRFINADQYSSTGQGFIGYNMFVFCLNNPVSFVDKNGASAEAVQWWAGTMWWLCGVDAMLPIGDLVYAGGILLLGTGILTLTWERPEPQIYLEEGEKTKPAPPDVTYPGDDPEKAPEGTEWKGKGKPGSDQGNYYNPKTGESWHPDLKHPDPIGPHWDYKDSHGVWWRVGRDNTIISK